MRILVVEDEQRIARSIKKGLEQERFTVDLSFTGPDGLNLGLEGTYEAIILDILLPGLDGLTVCRQLRSEGVQTPILILTAKSQIQDKVTGLNIGADDYLTKPFAFEELLARIRALIRRPKNSLGPVLSVDDLYLNQSTYEVKRDGALIYLSPKEFSLLEYLMRNKGKILSKEQIINHVWEYDADILPNTVEAFIKSLRAKIEKPFDERKALLQTVRGFGYKMGEKDV